MINNMFSTNEIITSALHATQLRNTVINNNIANADVPNFRRSVVEFESMLQSELERVSRDGGPINFLNISPRISTSPQNLPERLDGNNVNIEAEMTALYQNSARYESLSISIMNNYRRINQVLTTNI